MKVFISLDMEGIAGTFTWTQEENNRAEVRKCISQQIEWVIEGIKAGKSNKSIDEILIADSHNSGDNLLYEVTALDDRLHLISGYPRPKYMMAGLDNTFSVVFFVGYHGGIGTIHSVMDHSYAPRFHRIWVNNKLMNESLINAAYAGWLNIPLGLVIGDDSLKKQLMEDNVFTQVEYVVTKYSLSRFSVKNRPVNLVKKDTINAVKNVMSTDLKKYPVYKLEPPFKLKIEFQTTSMADLVEMLPDVKRLDGYTIELGHDDYSEIFDAIDAIATLARAAKW